MSSLTLNGVKVKGSGYAFFTDLISAHDHIAGTATGGASTRRHHLIQHCIEQCLQP
jgi:hypothetical protein